MEWTEPTLCDVVAAGGGILEIVGSQFFNVTVTLGGKVCPIAGSHNDTHLSCTIPAGVGFELDISITSLTNPGFASMAGVFSYEPPFVTAVIKLQQQLTCCSWPASHCLGGVCACWAGAVAARR